MYYSHGLTLEILGTATALLNRRIGCIGAGNKAKKSQGKVRNFGRGPRNVAKHMILSLTSQLSLIFKPMQHYHTTICCKHRYLKGQIRPIRSNNRGDTKRSLIRCAANNQLPRDVLGVLWEDLDVLGMFWDEIFWFLLASVLALLGSVLVFLSLFWTLLVISSVSSFGYCIRQHQIPYRAT